MVATNDWAVWGLDEVGTVLGICIKTRRKFDVIRGGSGSGIPLPY